MWKSDIIGRIWINMCARLSEVSDLSRWQKTYACSREYLVRFIHDFLLNLSRTRTSWDSILVVVKRFFKIMHFITCKKTKDFVTVEYLFFWEWWICVVFQILLLQIRMWNLLASFGAVSRISSKHNYNLKVCKRSVQL